MSRQDTIALVERYLQAFNASDIDAMLECLDEDVAHDINEGPREIGKDRFRWFMGMMAQHYSETLRDIEIMAGESGVRAAAEFTVDGTYKVTADGLPEATGQTYSLPAGIFFEVDDGLITRVTTYYNLKAWTDQVA